MLRFGGCAAELSDGAAATREEVFAALCKTRCDPGGTYPPQVSLTLASAAAGNTSRAAGPL